jgi:hypothetical protein
LGVGGYFDVVCEKIYDLFKEDVVPVVAVFKVEGANCLDVIETSYLVAERVEFIAKRV